MADSFANPVGLVFLFNRWATMGLFALLGLFVGLIATGGERRRNIPRGEKAPEWAMPPSPTTPTAMLAAALVGAIAPGALFGYLLGPVVGIGLGLLGAILSPASFLSRQRGRWAREIEEESLSLLQLLILKLQSGQSLIPALEEVAQVSLRGPLKREILEFIVGAVAGGATVTQSLARLRDSARYKNAWRYQRILRHLTTATRAQMPAPKIAARMAVLQESLVDTYSLQLELESELAQAKYSRWIVTATLPFTTFALFVFAPEIAVNLVETIAGQITLVAVTVMVVLLHVVGGQIAKLPPLEL